MNRTYLTMDDAGITFDTLAAALGYSESSTSTYSTYANTLANMMRDTYIDSWIYYFDGAYTDADVTTANYKWLQKLKMRARMLKDKYQTLLDSYTSYKGSVMQTSYQNRTTNKYNDTPQEAGDFTGEQFTSNYSEGTSAATTNYIDKLAEINDKFQVIYKDWLREFNDFFGF